MKTLFLFNKVVYISFFLMFSQPDVWAQPGEPDNSFNGHASTQYVYGMGLASVIQTDGKLLVAGYYYDYKETLPPNNTEDILILRYNEDGTPDADFGDAGVVITDLGRYEECRSIALQVDGKILVAGVSGQGNLPDVGFLARYQADGKPDSSFGINGHIIASYNDVPYGGLQCTGLKLLADGTILVNGHRGGENYINEYRFIAKYHANGVPDDSFGNSGLLPTPNAFQTKESFDIQPDGKIVVATTSIGNYFGIARYLPNGQPDVTFNNTGYVQTYIDSLGGNGYLVKLQPDGKILLAGTKNVWYGPSPGNDNGYDFAAIRYNANGTIDTGFGNGGVVSNRFQLAGIPSKIEIQKDGKILLAGSTGGNLVAEGDYVLVRYLSNGKMDSLFGNNGSRVYASQIYGVCNSMDVKDQQILLSGWTIDGATNAVSAYTLAVQNDDSTSASNSLTLCASAATALLAAGIQGVSYQWQFSTDGFVFNNISNDVYYNGTNSPNLLLNNIPTSFNGYQYRCVTPIAISKIFTIHFLNTWTGAISNAWENPGNWSCNQVPDSNTNSVIYSGNVVVNSTVTVKSLTVKKDAAVLVGTGNTLNVLQQQKILQ
ncbi:MAG: hypothetical protein ABI760_05435 [Ferruginibacter sp.]